MKERISSAFEALIFKTQRPNNRPRLPEGDSKLNDLQSSIGR